jgi:3-hydroxy acid dehydrogenase/malonic semialdehyde reductase
MIIFVTGASAGFGAALVRKFVQEGHQVVASGRRTERLEQLADALGPSVLPFRLDVTDPDAVEAVPAALPAPFRAVDVLVNNAGLALGLEPAQRANLDDWDAMIDTNVTGLVRMTRSLLRGMRERGHGHIINIGSVAGSFPYAGGNVYGASKAFVGQFSVDLFDELRGTPIRVSNIAPGLSGGTEFSNVRFKGDDKRASKIYEGLEPLSPEDIANTAYWIATRPAHVNIGSVQIMPVVQAPGGTTLHRT